MVKRQGLFDDPAAEINALVAQIKTELSDLNRQVDSAQVRRNRQAHVYMEPFLYSLGKGWMYTFGIEVPIVARHGGVWQ